MAICMAIVWLSVWLSVWLLYGYCMAIVWLLYGYCMAIVWLLYGYCMAVKVVVSSRYTIRGVTICILSYGFLWLYVSMSTSSF